MSDYIKREDAIKLCIDIINFRTTEMINMGVVEPAESINVIELAYKKLPSADVIERKRGEWVDTHKKYCGSTVYACSECKSEVDEIPTFYEKPVYKWCPNCGARMKGADDE